MSGSPERTLLLDQSYVPLKVISWQRALTLLFLNKAEILKSYDEEVKSPSVTLKIPAVVRLLRAFKRFRKPIKFSRINLLARDRWKCAYCGIKLTMSEVTYDHVIPRAQGGTSCWRNIVSACRNDNARKADRTPEQAGMKLRSKPEQPSWVPVLVMDWDRKVPDVWREYLYWTSPLSED